MIYEKDTLMRMLTVFLQKLAEKLSNKPISEITELEMEEFFLTTLEKNREYILCLDNVSLLETCKFENNFSIEKCRVLAELLYIETLRIKGDKQIELAKKSLFLFENYIQKTKTYDVEITQKINQLMYILSNE
jgi:hypothetical protein